MLIKHHRVAPLPPNEGIGGLYRLAGAVVSLLWVVRFNGCAVWQVGLLTADFIALAKKTDPVRARANNTKNLNFPNKKKPHHGGLLNHKLVKG